MRGGGEQELDDGVKRRKEEPGSQRCKVAADLICQQNIVLILVFVGLPHTPSAQQVARPCEL